VCYDFVVCASRPQWLPIAAIGNTCVCVCCFPVHTCSNHISGRHKADTRTCTLTHTHTHILTCIRMHTHMHTHIHKHAYTLTDTHHTQTHTHTHTCFNCARTGPDLSASLGEAILSQCFVWCDCVYAERSTSKDLFFTLVILCVLSQCFG
jgi:hypothetical protein